MDNWDMALTSVQAQKLVDGLKFNWLGVRDGTTTPIEDQKQLVAKLVTFMLEQPGADTISHNGFRVTRGHIGNNCYLNVEFILDYAVIVWPQEMK
jgi:hypothetical protein